MSSREPVILGIDTSNYTTSAARLEGGEIFQSKKLLPVKPGQLGLRQSDAVFHHVQQLPDRLEEVLQGAPPIRAIGVSDRPRAQEGSYMPCFTVGVGTARALAAAMRRLLDEPGLLVRMGAAGRDLACREFDAEVVAEKILVDMRVPRAAG